MPPSSTRCALEQSRQESIVRKPVRLDLAHAPFVDGRWQALRFGNANGEDLYLYPGFVMVHDGGSFALIEIDQLDLESFSLASTKMRVCPPTHASSGTPGSRRTRTTHPIGASGITGRSPSRSMAGSSSGVEVSARPTW